MLGQTVARLTSTRCPRMVTTYKRMNGLKNSVEMISARQQRKENKLSDAYSKSEGRMMLDRICREADSPGLTMKASMERLYLDKMGGATSRLRRAVARKEQTMGFVLMADNLDWVCSSF